MITTIACILVGVAGGITLATIDCKIKRIIK